MSLKAFPLLLLIAALDPARAAAAPADKALAPQPLPGSGSSLVWEAPQFIQGDKKGNVFVFRAGRFEVYPVTRRGDLGEPERLKVGAVAGGKVLDAAMSPAGDEWIVFNGPGAPLLRFRQGKGEALPAVGWSATSVGWVRATPVVSVVPFWEGRLPPGFKKPSSPPLLLTPDSSKWSSLISEDLPAEGGDPVISAMTRRSAVLVGDSQSKLWVANQYLYRIRRFSAAGRLLLDLTLGDGEPVEEASSEKMTIRLRREARKEGMPVEKAVRSGVMTAKRQIQAAAWGRDGRLYLLVAAGEGHALDRYDPSSGVLERAALNLPNGNRFVSLAAGRDALYLAAYRGTDGRMRILWEDLEAANWKSLKDINTRYSQAPGGPGQDLLSEPPQDDPLSLAFNPPKSCEARSL